MRASTCKWTASALEHAFKKRESEERVTHLEVGDLPLSAEEVGAVILAVARMR
jgi:hypothetical protein